MTRSDPRSPPPRWRSFAEWALIFAVTLAAYAPALRSAFIWNDRDYVTKPALQSLAGLGRIWFEFGATEQYYPLLHSAFWVEHRLWGDAPLGYHLLNVALHALSAGLLLLLLRRLALPGALLAALVFALHPVCVETVAWISEQKNTLSTVCYLLAALRYLRFDADRSPGRYAQASLLFALAVLSKTVTATLPAALLVVLWWRSGSLSWRRDVRPLLPWLAAGALAGQFSGWVERHYVGAQGAAFALDGTERVLLASRAAWFYLGKLLWPANLIFIYPRWTISRGDPAGYGYLFALLAAFAVLWALRRRRRAPLASGLLFVGTLLPTLGFFNIYAFVYSYVADHWQYLACLGVIAPACAGLAAATRRWSPALRGGAAAALLGLLAGLTWRQAHRYRDMETFYRATLERNPGAWMAHNNLGILLREEHRRPEAISQFAAALKLEPDAPEIHNNFGAGLEDAGRLDEAEREYRAALRLAPRYAIGYNNLAYLLYQTRRLPEALAAYDTALQLDPRHPAANFNRGRVLEDLGRTDEALAEFQIARRLDPALPGVTDAIATVHNNRGQDLAGRGQTAAAIGEYREALRWNSRLPEAHNNLGVALGAAGQRAEGIAELTEALRLRANYPEAHYNWGVILAGEGRNEEAIPEYAAALRLKPDDAAAESNWGAALALLGRPQEAIPHLARAIQLQPGNRAAHFNLGLALRAAGRPTEARQEFETAARLKAAAGG
jgi:tetratricopeptide (TPR) repeat protein